MDYKIRQKRFNFIRMLLFILLSVLLLMKIIFLNKKTIFVFNYALMIVMSDSMEPEYQTSSFIIIKKSSIDELMVRDVIAYKSDALNGSLAFHRIVRITDEGIFTKGDNNNLEEHQVITTDAYAGVCVFHTNLFAGYLTGVKNPRGFRMLFVLPLTTIIMFSFAVRSILCTKGMGGVYESLL